MTRAQGRAIQAKSEVVAASELDGEKHVVALFNPSKGQKAEDAKVCIDQFEFPNIPCEYPMTWMRDRQAHLICKAIGRRLCDAHEWDGARRTSSAGGGICLYARSRQYVGASQLQQQEKRRHSLGLPKRKKPQIMYNNRAQVQQVCSKRVEVLWVQYVSSTAVSEMCELVWGIRSVWQCCGAYEFAAPN